MYVGPCSLVDGAMCPLTDPLTQCDLILGDDGRSTGLVFHLHQSVGHLGGRLIKPIRLPSHPFLCVCVFVYERERERERVYVFMCAHKLSLLVYSIVDQHCVYGGEECWEREKNDWNGICPPSGEY